MQVTAGEGGTGGGGGPGSGTAAAAAARKGRVSVELTSLAAGYLVSLLKEPEVAQELWPLITRCMDNLSARRSVPASLEVLRRAIATLPAHEAKSWFGGSRLKENRWVGGWVGNRPYFVSCDMYCTHSSYVVSCTI